VGGEHVNDVGGRWKSRPLVAAALRVAVVAVPALASLVAVWLCARVVPPPADQALLAAARLGLLLAVGVAVAVAVERLARRLLPLVVLLKMSMLFPDRAPSRLRTARRACSASVDASLAPRTGDDAAAVAERVVALLAALASHDRRTRGHAHRVHVLAELLARELGLSRTERDKLRWAALLHDIGKLSVAPAVLNKPAKLDDDEWAILRGHPLEGARLAGPLLAWLGPWGDAIGQHHERYDGHGYPLGLAGDQIGYAGRLVCLVDAFETMTAARPYKKAMATRDARAELASCAGTQFDPAMARAFLAIPLPRLLWAGGPLAFLVQLPFLPLIEAGGRTASAALSTATAGVLAGGTAVVVGGALGLAPTATAAPTAHATRPVASASPTSSSGPGTSPSPGPPGGPSTGTPAGQPTPTATPSTGPVPSPGTTPTASTAPTAAPTPAPTVVVALPTLPVALPTLPVALPVPLPTDGVTVDLPVLPPVTIKLPKL
jgi:putative nucleotidyltransferase with HDIG domain